MYKTKQRLVPLSIALLLLFCLTDASEWSDEQQANALSIKKAYKDVNLLTDRQISQRTYFAERVKMKGRDRNKLCPCGSGKKLKRCCGKA